MTTNQQNVLGTAFIILTALLLSEWWQHLFHLTDTTALLLACCHAWLAETIAEKLQGK